LRNCTICTENAGYTVSIMSGFFSDRALKSSKGYTYDVKLAFEKGYQQRKYLEIPHN
jgi:hypothetical protein